MESLKPGENADAPTEATLLLSGNAKAWPGDNVLEIERDLSRDDDTLLRVTLSADADQLRGNESAEFLVPAPEREPSLAIFDTSADRVASKELHRAIVAAGMRADYPAPAWLSEHPADLERYDAFIVAEARSADLHRELQVAIASRVRSGAGIAMLGGRWAFAMGGWSGSPLEEVLPVTCKVESDRKSKVAVAVVLDASGSMSASAGGATKMDQANRGAELTMNLVLDGDTFGVMRSESDDTWIVPLRPLNDRAQARSAILACTTGGRWHPR